jgi:hypothetical protein
LALGFEFGVLLVDVGALVHLVEVGVCGGVMDYGQRTTDNGRRTTEGGVVCTTDYGQRTTDNGAVCAMCEVVFHGCCGCHGWGIVV